MARTVSAPERTLLAGNCKFHRKVEVQNGSGTWKELTNLSSVDWVNSVRISENIDTRVMEATIVVKARVGALSLNPLMASSTLNRNDLAAYSPLLNPGRGLRVWESVTALGAGPGTYHKVFEGILDEPDATDDGEKITLNARDLGRWLINKVRIDDRVIYSDAAGQPVEDIIQQILNDELGAQAPTVVLPAGSPGWNIREFRPGRLPVMDVVTALSDQIGWDQRYRWPAVGDTLEWHLYPVDRAKTVADWTLPPTEYLRVRSLKFSDNDIRNVIRVYFKDRLDGGAINYAEARDNASIGAFGGIERYMEVREDAASNIDTMVEAQAMADAILSDLSTPMADFSITSFHLWFAQLGDLVAFPQNSVHYDSDQKFGIVSITRTWEAGKAQIEILTRGKISGQYLAWLKKHGKGRFDEDNVARPIFEIPIGEDSEGGGVSGDGAVWMDARFDKNTKEIRAYAEESEDQYTLVPDISEITKAWGLVRQEGTETMLDDWATMLPFCTRPFWFKRIRAFGINSEGVPGPETIFDVVQAIDLMAVVDGEVTAITLTQGTDNVLDIDIGNTDPNVPSYLIVTRDGIVIRKKFIGFQNNYTETITDYGARITVPHRYEAFIWTNGVSGVHAVNTDLVGTPPIFTLPNTGKLKIIAMQVMDINGSSALRVDYKANVAGFATAVLEESDDNGVGDPWAPSVIISQNPGQFTGYFWTADYTTPRYYRVRVDTYAGTSVYSPVVNWTAVNIPPPVSEPTALPRFVNGTPKLSFLGLGSPTVELEYDISATSFTSMRLETSLDGITGWVEIDSDTNQHAIFYDANTSAKYYRLRAVGGAVDLYSQPAYFPGFKVKPGGGTNTQPPVFVMSLEGITYPVLRIAWTCANPSAVEVTIERSVDDGATDPWTEVRRDAQVAQGYWDTSAHESYFYRMKAKDSADATLATSASQEHDALIYFP